MHYRRHAPISFLRMTLQPNINIRTYAEAIVAAAEAMMGVFSVALFEQTLFVCHRTDNDSGIETLEITKNVRWARCEGTEAAKRTLHDALSQMLHEHTHDFTHMLPTMSLVVLYDRTALDDVLEMTQHVRALREREMAASIGDRRLHLQSLERALLEVDRSFSSADATLHSTPPHTYAKDRSFDASRSVLQQHSPQSIEALVEARIRAQQRPHGTRIADSTENRELWRDRKSASPALDVHPPLLPVQDEVVYRSTSDFDTEDALVLKAASTPQRLAVGGDSKQAGASLQSVQSTSPYSCVRPLPFSRCMWIWKPC
jgi:hypothetical protein